MKKKPALPAAHDSAINHCNIIVYGERDEVRALTLALARARFVFRWPAEFGKERANYSSSVTMIPARSAASMLAPPVPFSPDEVRTLRARRQGASRGTTEFNQLMEAQLGFVDPVVVGVSVFHHDRDVKNIKRVLTRIGFKLVHKGYGGSWVGELIVELRTRSHDA